MSDQAQSESAISLQSRVIWGPVTKVPCQLVAGLASHEALYNDILSVRYKTDSRWPDQRTAADKYSDHYCMYVDGTPVGSLGVTRLLDGEIFLQEYCPQALLDTFHDTLVSAYRFRIVQDYRRTSPKTPGVNLSRHMVREAWREQIRKGAMIDVMNIELIHFPLYQRMGYELCEGSEYNDPILGTPSGIMFLSTDPDRPSVIQDIVKEMGVTLRSESVQRALRKKIFAVG